jgi:hypothetical protein
VENQNQAVAVKTAPEPVGVPSEPVVTQSLTVEVMSNGNINIRSTPPVEKWSIMGLLTMVLRQMGG